MQATITTVWGQRQVDFAQPIDISIPLREGADGVNCFYAPYLETAPVIAGDFVGATAQGGPVNFLNVRFNPHGNGTHTECVGHIATAQYTINQSLGQFLYEAQLLSLYPTRSDNGDRVIQKHQLEEIDWPSPFPRAVILRTLPNDDHKLNTNYSGSNPPYLQPEAMQWLTEQGTEHFLVDLPSVDRESDGGALAAHKAFWRYPENPRKNCTITELIYVNNSVPDGLYLLNLQVASFEIDVSPSKPVLYAFLEE